LRALAVFPRPTSPALLEVMVTLNVSSPSRLASPTTLTVIVPVVFACGPAAIPSMLSEIVQNAPAPNVPPARVIDGEFAGAVTVPPQSLLRLLGEATIRPEGNTSVNAIPVSGLPFGLTMVKNKKTVPFKATLSAEKNLEMTGGAAWAYAGADQEKEKIIAAAKTAALTLARISREVLLPPFPMRSGL